MGTWPMVRLYPVTSGGASRIPDVAAHVVDGPAAASASVADPDDCLPALACIHLKADYGVPPDG